MAIAEVIKQAVEQLTADDYTVTIHVTFKEGVDVLFEKDYSERYFSDLSVDTIKQKLQDQIQADWDEYVAEQALFDATAFDTMVSEIQTAANTYINL